MFKKQLVMIVFTLCMQFTYAQVKISGVVFNEYLEPFYNAKIASEKEVVLSNVKGEFTITVEDKFPQVIDVTAFGHQLERVTLVSAKGKVNVILKENYLLDQVVISASRVPERIIESPVTIERLGLTEIKRRSSNSFYDGLANLKGIHTVESSYGYKSVNARGFADLSNSRFVQLVDGMDTAAPALNFSAGNLSGISDLDIHSVEILPGASSALYGANAYNGIMLMKTKNPFDFTGVSFLLKSGFTQQDAAGNNAIKDVSVRMAHKFSDAFAAKVNFSYFEAEEWHANDTRNKQIDTSEIIEGEQNTVLSYDGVNSYGDENIQNLTAITRAAFGIQLPEVYLVNRTGYAERDLLRDYTSKNLKFSASLHYRPFKDESLEVILAGRVARGDNIFQGTSRFAQRDYYIGQSKLEVKGDNFYVRGYYTRNDAGNTYDLTRTGLALNSKAAENNSFGLWGYDYLIALINAGGFNADNTINLDPAALKAARDAADATRIQPGTAEFNREFNNITSTLLTEGGSKIYDRSAYTHVDGNYNFSSLLDKWADVQVGGSFRRYNPDSQGTIFNDGAERIRVDEYGIYTQIQKKFLDERLKLTGSIRYDKSQNFDANYSPRFAVNYALDEDKDHILRASYQTGFRNPTIQEQYLFIPGGGAKLNVGTSSDNLSRINVDGITGNDIINNSLFTRSVLVGSGFTGDLYIKSDYEAVRPEEVQTVELGYRSMIGVTDINNINLDINGFFSVHNDFLFFQDVVAPTAGKVYPFGQTPLTAAQLADPDIQAGLIIDGVLVLDSEANNGGSPNFREFNIVTNAKSTVQSYGVGVGLSTKLLNSFDFGVNYDFIDFSFDDKDGGFFEPNFNTPKHTVRVQLGNNNLFKNFGFNVNARWQDKFRWVSPFIKGDIDARTVLDAQINYRIPAIKSKFKIGGTNLLGKEYLAAPGSGRIGSLYYFSWTINN